MKILSKINQFLKWIVALNRENEVDGVWVNQCAPDRMLRRALADNDTDLPM